MTFVSRVFFGMRNFLNFGIQICFKYCIFIIIITGTQHRICFIVFPKILPSQHTMSCGTYFPTNIIFTATVGTYFNLPDHRISIYPSIYCTFITFQFTAHYEGFQFTNLPLLGELLTVRAAMRFQFTIPTWFQFTV